MLFFIEGNDVNKSFFRSQLPLYSFGFRDNIRLDHHVLCANSIKEKHNLNLHISCEVDQHSKACHSKLAKDPLIAFLTTDKVILKLALVSQYFPNYRNV